MTEANGFGGVFGGRPIDIFAADVEGCFTTSNRRVLGVNNLNACEAISRRYSAEAKAYNLPPIIFVTGRAGPYLEHVAQSLGIEDSIVASITENGAVLWDHETKLPMGYHPAVEERRNDLHRVKGFIDGLLVGEYRGKMVLEPGKEICISLNPRDSSVEQLYERVWEELDREDYLGVVNITHSASAVDITPKGVSKKDALEFLLKKHDINPRNVLGIGDTIGDVDWLNVIGMPCAPRNATADLRKGVKGLDVSNYPETQGVWDTLYRYIVMHSTEPS